MKKHSVVILTACVHYNTQVESSYLYERWLVHLKILLDKNSPQNIIKWEKSVTNTSHYSIKQSEITLWIHLAKRQQHIETYYLINYKYLCAIQPSIFSLQSIMFEVKHATLHFFSLIKNVCSIAIYYGNIIIVEYPFYPN